MIFGQCVVCNKYLKAMCVIIWCGVCNNCLQRVLCVKKKCIPQGVCGVIFITHTVLCGVISLLTSGLCGVIEGGV